MELQLAFTDEQMRVHPGGTHQPRQSDRRGASANHHDVTTAVSLHLAVLERMGQELLWKVRNAFRYIREVRNPDCQNHAPGTQLFTVIQSHFVAIAQLLDQSHHFVLEFWHEPFLERQPVGSKRVEADGDAGIVVRDTAFLAERLHCHLGIGISEIRGEPIRLEHHAHGHVRKPTVHWRPKDTVQDIRAAEVGGDRKSVRSSSNNRDFNHGNLSLDLVVKLVVDFAWLNRCFF